MKTRVPLLCMLLIAIPLLCPRVAEATKFKGMRSARTMVKNWLNSGARMSLPANVRITSLGEGQIQLTRKTKRGTSSFVLSAEVRGKPLVASSSTRVTTKGGGQFNIYFGGRTQQVNAKSSTNKQGGQTIRFHGKRSIYPTAVISADGKSYTIKSEVIPRGQTSPRPLDPNLKGLKLFDTMLDASFEVARKPSLLQE